MSDTPRDRWIAALESRHLAHLQFSEVTRALRALSTIYVGRRERLTGPGALDTAGKRAAYAMYYGPLHFLTIAAVVDGLGAARSMSRLLDVGCGTGAAGAAWAAAVETPPAILGVDRLPWALEEAAFTYRTMRFQSATRRAHAGRVAVPHDIDAVVAGWMVNELDAASRDALLPRLLQAATRGTRVLIVEPIATRVSPWWPGWARAFASAGGRQDEWRIPAALPDLIRRLDIAAGLRHDVLTARSIYVERP
jgi:hypothetical protein